MGGQNGDFAMRVKSLGLRHQPSVLHRSLVVARSLWCAVAIVLCLTGLARAEAPVAQCPVFEHPGRTARIAQWIIEWRASEAAGFPDVALHVSSFRKLTHGGRFSCLVVQCIANDTSVYLETNGGVAAGADRRVAVTYKVDDRPRSMRSFPSSSDGLALGLWRTPNAVSFAKELLGGRILHVSLSSHAATAMRGDFEIAGFDDAIKSAGGECRFVAAASQRIGKISAATLRVLESRLSASLARHD
jgi:hypothetical protein